MKARIGCAAGIILPPDERLDTRALSVKFQKSSNVTSDGIVQAPQPLARLLFVLVASRPIV